MGHVDRICEKQKARRKRRHIAVVVPRPPLDGVARLVDRHVVATRIGVGSCVPQMRPQTRMPPVCPGRRHGNHGNGQAWVRLSEKLSGSSPQRRRDVVFSVHVGAEIVAEGALFVRGELAVVAFLPERVHAYASGPQIPWGKAGGEGAEMRR